MGLRFPADLDAWQRWQDRRRLVRATVHAVRSVVRPSPATPAFLTVRTGDPSPVVISVLESRAASSRHAVLAPLRHMDAVSVGVLSPFDPREFLDGDGWESRRIDSQDLSAELPDARVVASAAHYLPLGAAAFADAHRRGHAYVTVQHGLLTPSAPPLPPNSPFIAWSDADARFWLSGRTDAEASVLGSQLLWAAAEDRATHVSRFDRPVFLGQLHGAELPRATMVRAVTAFCRETGASYRPHPSETDRLSTLQHRVWQKMGIDIDNSGRPLSGLRSPVVSIYSTGLLEAAAQGVPAWTSFKRPPAWLAEFWNRYGLRPWGGSPTETPPLPAVAPAHAIARWLEARL